MDADGNAWVDMPIIKGEYANSIKRLSETSAIVKMYGITHLVMEVAVATRRLAKNL